MFESAVWAMYVHTINQRLRESSAYIALLPYLLFVLSVWSNLYVHWVCINSNYQIISWLNSWSKITDGQSCLWGFTYIGFRCSRSQHTQKQQTTHTWTAFYANKTPAIYKIHMNCLHTHVRKASDFLVARCLQARSRGGFHRLKRYVCMYVRM